MVLGSTERYFMLVLLLSVPFWALGEFAGIEALPGVPASALMVIVPALVAVGLVGRSDGVEVALWWINAALNTVALRRPIWVLTALLLPPVTFAAAYGVMRLGGYSMPAPETGVVGFVLLVAVFILPALLEELGWSSFALEKLQRRMSAFSASIVIGAIWAVWHLVPLIQIGRSIAWIASWAAATVMLRVLITWVYNRGGGNVLLAALFHASVNAGWQSFPVRGSHYDPAVHAIVLVATTALLIGAFGTSALARADARPER